jgi:hypothetical protein
MQRRDAAVVRHRLDRGPAPRAQPLDREVGAASVTAGADEHAAVAASNQREHVRLARVTSRNQHERHARNEGNALQVPEGRRTHPRRRRRARQQQRATVSGRSRDSGRGFVPAVPRLARNHDRRRRRILKRVRNMLREDIGEARHRVPLHRPQHLARHGHAGDLDGARRRKGVYELAR